VIADHEGVTPGRILHEVRHYLTARWIATQKWVMSVVISALYPNRQQHFAHDLLRRSSGVDSSSEVPMELGRRNLKRILQQSKLRWSLRCIGWCADSVCDPVRSRLWVKIEHKAKI